MRIFFGAVAASCAAFAVPSSLAQLTIADLAPSDAFFVASVPSGEALRERFEATALGGLLETPAYEQWLKRAGEEEQSSFMKDLRERLDERDLSFERILIPPGSAGVAVWARLDRTTGFPTFHTLTVADYADDADDLRAVFEETIDEAIDERLADIEEEEFDDFIVYSISRAQDEEEEDVDPGFDDPMDGFDAGRPELEIFERSHFAWIDDALLLSDDLDALLLAADRLLGEEEGDSVRQTRGFGRAMDSIGPVQAYASVFIEPLAMAIRAGEEAGVFAAEQGPPIPDLLRASGLAETRTLAIGLRLDAEDAMLEAPFAVTFERPEGIYALFGASDGLFEPPAFVGADSTGVTQMQVRFDQVVPLVQRIVGGLPQAMQQQAQMQVMGLIGMVGPVLQVLGPDVLAVSRLARPFTPESETGFVAIRTMDERTVSNALAQLGGMMGLRPRDFDGSEIWEPQQGGMLPIPVIGLGYGHVFVGGVESVEDALRLAARPEGGALAEEPRFEDATRSLDPNAFLFSYTEFSVYLEYQRWIFENAEEYVRSQLSFLREGEGEQEWIRDAIDAQVVALDEQAERTPPLGPLIETVGDFTAEMHAAPGALRGRMLLYESKE